MALNDYDSSRRYTKYKRHVDDSHERVAASTVNTLQDDLNAQQEDANLIKDNAFEERVYTIFNNNLYTNAMFIDYFKTGEYQSGEKSSDTVIIVPEKRQLTLKESATAGTAISTQIYSVHGADIALNDFFLIANESIPIGCKVKYFLETYKGERWPIPANRLKTPLHLTENLTNGFRVVIELSANALGEKPCINGYAILYWDAKVEDNYGMTNPDLMRFP